MKCSLDYPERTFRQPVIAQPRTLHPFDTADIVSGARRVLPHHCTHVVDQDVMILGSPGRIAYDALENLEHRGMLDPQAGLFEHFTPDRVLKSFAGFDESAGNRPVAFQRLTRALDEQNRIAPENQRAYAGQRMFRITAANSGTPLSRPS